ncbi:hypothetical protein BKA83DRAFT_2995480 [Pisolithus microcarpus]|nr:hypothetical protein BKA83DRAFT_2995480 [Pisolithus microcarpus]
MGKNGTASTGMPTHTHLHCLKAYLFSNLETTCRHPRNRQRLCGRSARTRRTCCQQDNAGTNQGWIPTYHHCHTLCWCSKAQGCWRCQGTQEEVNLPLNTNPELGRVPEASQGRSDYINTRGRRGHFVFFFGFVLVSSMLLQFCHCDSEHHVRSCNVDYTYL